MASPDPPNRCKSCESAVAFRVCTKEYNGTHTTYYVCTEHAKQVDVDGFTEITFTRVTGAPKNKIRVNLLSFYADDAAAGKAGLKKGDLWCTYDSRVHEKT